MKQFNVFYTQLIVFCTILIAEFRKRTSLKISLSQGYSFLQNDFMKYSSIIFIAAVLVSCSSAKLSVPEKFKSQATQMPVKGINGWQINQQLSFGNFQTSKIKRGWDFTASVSHTKFRISPEEAVSNPLGLFNKL